MLNTAVSIGNAAAGRMISGMLAMSLDHPFVLTSILAVVAGATVAMLLDLVEPRTAARTEAMRAKRPIRMRRR